jgi:hypothetical protein
MDFGLYFVLVFEEVDDGLWGDEVEGDEVTLDDAKEEAGFDFDEEFTDEGGFVALEHIEDDEDALLVDVVEHFEALGLVEAALLDVALLTEEGGHVAEVLEEGGLHQAFLVLDAGDGDHLVDEINERQDDGAGFLAHHLEEPADLEDGHVDEAEGVVLLFVVGVDLLAHECLEFDVVALAEQLQELEDHAKDVLLEHLFLLLQLVLQVHALELLHPLDLGVVVIVLVQRIHQELVLGGNYPHRSLRYLAGDLLAQPGYQFL